MDKFKPKKTTDDCYTPPEVMEVVNSYVERRWGIDRSRFVRPFFPGGDYEHEDYPDGCVVVDNPPFSILSKIKRFFEVEGIAYFLFCPSLTALSGKDCTRRTHIICDANITYENGAVVLTAFVTNLPSGNIVETEPEFGARFNAVANEVARRGKKTVPKYEYPYCVLTAARSGYLAKHGIDYRLPRSECVRISKLDCMGKRGIFGGGLLLSERAAAERAAAERAAAERAAAYVWELSDRERALQSMIGGG